MDIKEAEILADSLMSQHLADRWKFKWDKATSRFGSCCNSSKTLTLSRKLTELNDIVDVKDKWIASCSNCDYTTLKARYSVNACGKCCKKYNNGKYTKKFHLKYELIQNKLGITK